MDPPDKGLALAARLSDRKMIPIPAAGHLVQEDCPEAILAAVLDTIAVDAQPR